MSLRTYRKLSGTIIIRASRAAVNFANNMKETLVKKHSSEREK